MSGTVEPTRHEVIVACVDGSPGGPAAVAEAAAIADRHGAELTHEIRVGHAADVIVRFLEDTGADLVVLGYRGHSRIRGFFIGTTAQKVNVYSKASVLVVKGPAASPDEPLWPTAPGPGR